MRIGGRFFSGRFYGGRFARLASAMPGGGEPSDLVTSVTHNGVTFNFDTPVIAGTDVAGEPYVVSDRAFSITSITPVSTAIEADGFVGNGTMVDPYMGGNAQGFDEYFAEGDASWVNAAKTPYSAALNADPAISGAITIGIGDKKSITKSVRLASVTAPEVWQVADRYVTLTIWDVALPAGAYAPAASSLTKPIYYRPLTFPSLRSLTMPVSFNETPAHTLALVPDNLGLWGIGGENTRRLRLDNAINPAASSNYAAQVSPFYSRLLAQLHRDTLTSGDRRDIVDRVIRFGAQVEAIIDRGGSISLLSGAGQGGGIHPWLYAAAFLTQSTTLMAKARALETQMMTPKWVPSAYVGAPTPGKSGASAQPFYDEHVGVPFVVPDEFGSNNDTRYGVIAASNIAWDMMALLPLQSGPNTVDFSTELLDDGAYDTTNQRAATLMFLDRYRTWTAVFGSYNPTDQWADLYDMMQPLIGRTPWTGAPDQVPDWNSYEYFTAGDGQISWDLNGTDFATEAVSRVDFRHSLDGVQWIEVSDVADAGVKTQLMRGVGYWCGLRQQSASGIGLWSVNYPKALSDMPGGITVDRNVVLTTGTEAAVTPTNTVAPAIYQRINPAWSYKVWEAAAATLSGEAVELIAGVGDWSGYPAPTFSYQWKRDGVAISGATGKGYNRVAADAGTVTSFTLIPSAGTAITSAGVTAPPLATLDAGVLIDTDFRGAWPIDYEAEVSAIASIDADYSHEPALQFVGLTTDMGGVRADKTGARGNITIPLSQSATADTTYDIVAQLVMDNWTNATPIFRVFGGVAGAESPLFEFTATPTEEVTVYNITGTFAIGSGDTDLSLNLFLKSDTGTGGTTGGDPILTKIKISNSNPVTGPVFFDDFSANTTGDYQSTEGTGTISYDAGGEDMLAAQGQAWDGWIKTAGIVVTPNVPLRLTVNALNEGAGVMQAAYRYALGGSSIAGSNGLANGTIGAGVDTAIIYEFTPTQSPVFIETIIRGDGAGTIRTHDITLEYV